jgi:hypothetical protein
MGTEHSKQSTDNGFDFLDLNKVETDQGEEVATCNTEFREVVKFDIAKFEIRIKGKSEKVTCQYTAVLLTWLKQQKKRSGIDQAPYSIKVEEHKVTNQVTITITADDDKGGLAQTLITTEEDLGAWEAVRKTPIPDTSSSVGKAGDSTGSNGSGVVSDPNEGFDTAIPRIDNTLVGHDHPSKLLEALEKNSERLPEAKKKEVATRWGKVALGFAESKERTPKVFYQLVKAHNPFLPFKGEAVAMGQLPKELKFNELLKQAGATANNGVNYKDGGDDVEMPETATKRNKPDGNKDDDDDDEEKPKKPGKPKKKRKITSMPPGLEGNSGGDPTSGTM